MCCFEWIPSMMVMLLITLRKQHGFHSKELITLQGTSLFTYWACTKPFSIIVQCPVGIANTVDSIETMVRAIDILRRKLSMVRINTKK